MSYVEREADARLAAMRARAEAAEARLAQIAEAVSEWNHTGDHYAAYKRIRDLSSSEPA